MATAEQIKSLIRSHFSGKKEHFYTVALQLAAYEARKGHTALAVEIRDLVDKERYTQSSAQRNISEDLNGLLRIDTCTVNRSALIMDKQLMKGLDRIIHEYHNRNKLYAYGLENRRKVLLVGPPGTGKTMTARMLGKELSLVLYTIQIDRLITRFMGESSAKLRQVFNLIEEEEGIYLFDEFDSIGGERSLDNDVGEMRRVLNTFLQFIEQDQSRSIVIAATNNLGLLDNALFRRFDDIFYYTLPDQSSTKQLIENVLGVFMPTKMPWSALFEISEGLSHAEIDSACRDAIKMAILQDDKKISTKQLASDLGDRKKFYLGIKGV